jgi:pimeloyl-ACP methyl ester carboxylesterase
VIPALAEHFDVLAIDLPGFGESQPVPAAGGAHPADLAASVAGLLDDLGITDPHVVGNSLGGWVALEFAHRRAVASLTLLSPAGLWRSRTPLYCRVSLRMTRWLAEHTAGLIGRLVDFRLGRILVLGQTHGRPTRTTPDDARASVHAMGTCPGFDATLRATATCCYRSRSPVDAPVTVAFGSRDLLLLRHQSRHLDELPAHTHQATLPGCGHVPMADDPRGVTALITASTARGRLRPLPASPAH